MLTGSTGLMIATLTAFDQANTLVYQSTREYPDPALLWEHIGCQQNNHRTIRVNAETETGIRYEVRFSPWTPERLFTPSRRFHDLLRVWGAQLS